MTGVQTCALPIFRADKHKSYSALEADRKRYEWPYCFDKRRVFLQFLCCLKMQICERIFVATTPSPALDWRRGNYLVHNTHRVHFGTAIDIPTYIHRSKILFDPSERHFGFGYRNDSKHAYLHPTGAWVQNCTHAPVGYYDIGHWKN